MYNVSLKLSMSKSKEKKGKEVLKDLWEYRSQLEKPNLGQFEQHKE